LEDEFIQIEDQDATPRSIGPNGLGLGPILGPVPLHLSRLLEDEFILVDDPRPP
jgi:hypothetical protein